MDKAMGKMFRFLLETSTMTSAVTQSASFSLASGLRNFLPFRAGFRPFLSSPSASGESVSFAFFFEKRKIFQSTEHQLRVFALEEEAKVFVPPSRPFFFVSLGRNSKDMWCELSHKTDINGYTQHHANGSHPVRSKQRIMTFPEKEKKMSPPRSGGECSSSMYEDLKANPAQCALKLTRTEEGKIGLRKGICCYWSEVAGDGWKSKSLPRSYE